MQLIVSGLANTPIPFKHLWGRYVLGFRPWHHCIACLQTKMAASVSPGMDDGVYPLRNDLPLFYLCGVAQPDTKKAGPDFARRRTNVHLAVRPRKGSVAAIGSVYGATFIIKDAEQIPIQPLPDGFEGLDREYYQCKNFQFGYQMFAARQVGKSAPHDVITTRRDESFSIRL